MSIGVSYKSAEFSHPVLATKVESSQEDERKTENEDDDIYGESNIGGDGEVVRWNGPN